jgi:hypothetical protein
MVHCTVKGCKNLIPPNLRCWECGKPHCEAHLKRHERCVRFRICPNLQCWKDHLPWCPKHMRHLGPLPVVKTLGEGRECVYVWYNKADFREARRRKKTIWLCKIGRTKGGPSGRTLAVAKTAHAGVPIVPLSFRTDDSKKLEGLIHATLAYSGRHEMGALGREWFRTNPREVEMMYRTFNRMSKSLQSSR